ncbi:phage portal protein [Halomonas sp. S2151]|uniref:phage portal protein n=1 Tax=Halomonas sp. S2151 TaxID=579478 RepID=UPI000695B079|nr:phage portal protein [Halomonas sp. S2151]
MELKDVIERRHPEYNGLIRHWNFLSATYAGGRDWFDANIFRYHKEGDGEFSKRRERAYRFNHTREIVNLVNKYVFRGQVKRQEEPPKELAEFWKRATRDGRSIDQFMRQADVKASTFGRVWIVVDSTLVADAAISVADQKASGGQVYAYIVPPTHMLDMGYGEDGELLWALIYEPVRDDDDPFASSGKTIKRWRIWTKEKWFLIEEQPKGNQLHYEIVKQGDNAIGVVPIVPLDALGNHESQYSSPALINDIAYLDRAVANYLSNLDAIIQDQTFSQLAIPAQNIAPGDDDYKQMVEMGTRRVFVYDGEGGAGPHFLSPDVKQASLIIDVVAKIINEIYHSVGVAGERTKADNSQGIDNSSGVAKAYDFERVNSLLSAKSAALQKAENEVARLVMLFSGSEEAVSDDLSVVHYPKDYDVRGLTDEFAISEQLSLIEAPDSVRREQMRALIDKLFPHMKEDLRREIEKELKDFPAQPEPTLPPLSGGQGRAEADEEGNPAQWVAE